MTQTEQDAKWIKSERKKLARLIGSVGTIVAEQALLERQNLKYELSLETANIGGLQLRIHKKGENEPIQSIEHWNLDLIMEQRSFHLDKELLALRIKEATRQINEIKQLASKYAKLNLK